MNLMHKIVSRLSATLILAAVSLLPTGCTDDNSACPDDPANGKTEVTLRFLVATRNTSPLSRADDCEDDAPASIAENYLNLQDIQFFIFNADRQLLATFFPDVRNYNDTYSQYAVTATLKLPYFDKAVEANSTAIQFYIMVVANSKNLGGISIAANVGTTVDDILSENVIFNSPANLATNIGWNPDYNANRYIPMAGMQSFTVSADKLIASTPEAPLDLGDIDMLRAVAKIEVIDKINAARDTRISGAALNGFFTTGTVLPSADQWPGYVTADVTLPTLPADAVYDTDTPLLFVKDDYALSLRTDGAHSVYSAYITEYSYETANQQEPMVTVSLQPDDKDKVPYKRPFYLAKYNQGSQYADPVTELLRNHIYRYEVTDLSVDNTLELYYTVCPMSTVTSDEISFN